MITREARISEVARRKARKTRLSNVSNLVESLTNDSNARALIDFVDRGALEEVEKMSSEGKIDANIIGSRGLTPLHLAGFAPIAQTIIDNDVSLNVKSCEKSSGENYGGGEFSMGGHTALHYSAFSGQLGVVRVLLQNKAHCRILNDSRQQAVQVASDRKYQKISRILTNPEEFLKREKEEKEEAEAAERAEQLKLEKEAERARIRKEARLRQRLEAHAKKVSSETSRAADVLLKAEKLFVPMDIAHKVNPPARLPT